MSSSFALLYIMMCRFLICVTLALLAQTEAFFLGGRWSSGRRSLGRRSWDTGSPKFDQCVGCLFDVFYKLGEIEDYYEYKDYFFKFFEVDTRVATHLCGAKHKADECLRVGPANCTTEAPFTPVFFRWLDLLGPICTGNVPNSEFSGVLECVRNEEVQAQWYILDELYTGTLMIGNKAEVAVKCRERAQPEIVRMSEIVQRNCSPASLRLACDYNALDQLCPQTQPLAACSMK